MQRGAAAARSPWRETRRLTASLRCQRGAAAKPQPRRGSVPGAAVRCARYPDVEERCVARAASAGPAYRACDSVRRSATGAGWAAARRDCRTALSGDDSAERGGTETPAADTVAARTCPNRVGRRRRTSAYGHRAAPRGGDIVKAKRRARCSVSPATARSARRSRAGWKIVKFPRSTVWFS